MQNLAPNPPASKANPNPDAATRQAAPPRGKCSIGTQPLAEVAERPDDDARLDQYYTQPDIARHCYKAFAKLFGPRRYLMVEPSAGRGAFLNVMPPGSLGFDRAPKHPAVVRADVLTLTIRRERPLAFIGNPPFGRNASLAVKFFNHAAMQGDVVAFILPRSFRKASIQNRLNRDFILFMMRSSRLALLSSEACRTTYRQYFRSGSDAV